MTPTLQHDFDLPPVQGRFTERLPGDPERANHRRQVHGAAWSRVDPTPVRAPRTLAWSRELAGELGLPVEFCQSQAFAEVMAGNRRLPGMEPYAMCYGGHQFGQWAGQLGDGRAINLGEIVDRHGRRQVLQLKGAGPTPYSRMADGRAVLRSSIREFLCSEAMHHLGVPTTRALSLVLTGEEVMRDMFYDGNPEAEPGAIVCRVAPSFLRPGNFELLAARGDKALLQRLVRFSIAEDFPELGDPEAGETVIAWYAEICRRTADLMVEWSRVGFVHGVMNTDNLSVLGLTLDYGPYGWLDDYDPNWTPNTTDAQGRRYRFGHQPQVAMWNMAQFGNALTAVVPDTEGLQAALDAYPQRFQEGWRQMMAAKLGLEGPQDRDDALFTGLEALLQATETDMTIFFRALAEVDPAAEWNRDRPLPEPLLPSLYNAEETDGAYREQARSWLRAWAERLAADGRSAPERRDAMRRVNPRFVLRNYLAQMAIDRATDGDAQMVLDLMEVLRRPYDEQPGHAEWAGRRPDWARNRPGCSMLSCSS